MPNEVGFHGHHKGKNFILEGTTAVTFDAQGYVREHIEYWDSAHNFYAKIPIVGFVLWAARRIVFL